MTQEITQYLGKLVLCPIFQPHRGEDGRRREQVVAHVRGRIVSVRWNYGRIDCLVEPTGGTGSIRATYTNLIPLKKTYTRKPKGIKKQHP